MNCALHPGVQASGACTGCGSLYCADDLLKVKNRNVCRTCAAEMLEDASRPAPAPAGPSVVVVQQQQQQQQQHVASADDGKPRGSVGWLIFWIIIFWPVAIWYYLTRRWR